MKILQGLREIAALYDVFIIDQYGVLHNGTFAHAGAIDAFHRLLHDHGKSVVILSNTSRRSCGVTRLLGSLGFDSDFLGAITGGEAAWKYLRDHNKLMGKCALMTSDMVANVIHRETNDQSIFHGLNLQVVPIADADFLLVEGSLQICYSDKQDETISIDFHRTGQSNDHIESFLASGLARGLPLVCTNPDLISIQHGNKTVHMSGKIAQMYQARGGQVLYFGKPLKEHFDACIQLASAEVPRSRIVHIGDSMQHDIQGAISAGVDSVFIGRGIHAHEVLVASPLPDSNSNTNTGTGPGGSIAESADEVPVLDRLRLESLVARINNEPTYAIAAFTW